MLMQDKEEEGVQVLKDDCWYRVPIIPDALFINVGDILEVTSFFVQTLLYIDNHHYLAC